MTKQSIAIIRHADAGFMAGVGDIGRPLTELGKTQSRNKSASIRAFNPEIVFCSPATRAKETLEMLQLNDVEVVEDLRLYEAEILEFFDILKTTTQKRILIVSHQPTVSIMAELMCPREQSHLFSTFSPATHVIIDFPDLTNLMGTGTLVELERG